MARRRFLTLGLAAAFAVAGGTAWVAQGGDSSPGPPPPTSGVIAHGKAPSGAEYEIARIESSAMGHPDAFCTEISSPAGAARGCDPVPDGDGRINGQPWRPSMSVIGSDRFFTALAPQGVTAMEVQVMGGAKAPTSRTVDAGSFGKFLVVAAPGRMVNSRDPGSSREYEVRLLDVNGGTVQQARMSDSGG
jgi:hypothetical protein